MGAKTHNAGPASFACAGFATNLRPSAGHISTITLAWTGQWSLVVRSLVTTYIRVQICSDAVQWSDIQYAEDVACSMRIFAASLEDQSLQEAAEGERSGSSARSRSRSRGGDEPHEDFDEESEAESFSLIPVGARKKLSHQGLSSTVDSHVFDGWCVTQSEASPMGVMISLLLWTRQSTFHVLCGLAFTIPV